MAGPVSSTQSSFWFKLLHDHDYQVATLTVSPHWPFLHAIKIDSTNLVIEVNLSAHILQGFHHLWHGIKTGCLTDDARAMLFNQDDDDDEQEKEVEEVKVEEPKEEATAFPFPDLEITGACSPPSPSKTCN